MKQELLIDIPVKSEANIHKHWIWHWHRKKRHQYEILCAYSVLKEKPKPPCMVTFIRISPRKLDSEDNLRYAFKGIKDFVAALLIPGKAAGRADGDARITWEYKQEKGKKSCYKIIFDY